MERRNEGSTTGGPQWKAFTVSKFKAYILFYLYMDMRQQLNIKSYWMREGSIFHCPSVSNFILWKHVVAL
jgi:hypothetical protein